MRLFATSLLALALCVSASAARSGTVAPIKAANAALTTADFPGATVSSQKAVGSAIVPLKHASDVYTRTFANVKFGGRQLASVTVSAAVATSTTSAHTAVAIFENPLARKGLVEGAKSTASSARLVRYRKLHVGDEAIDTVMTLVEDHQTVVLGMMFLQVGTVVETVLYVSGKPGLSLGASANLAKLAVARIKAASGAPPANTVLPTIAGTPGLGQILTAQTGTWKGPTPTFTDQWMRCNPTGADCTAIAGATQQSYTASTADQGQTLAVSVTATTSAGAVTAMSLPTALVS